MTQAYDELRVFHNPRCSKSRETLALLQQRGLNPQVIEYLKTPPSLAQLQALQRLLGLPAREMLRSGEEAYRELGLADASLSDEQLLQAIADHPVLLQRPIVVHESRAVIARPPELALQVLAPS
jgi:arsenate reductase